MKQIISPEQLRVKLGQTGMPVDKDLYATMHFSWQELMPKQKELPSLEVLKNLLKVANVLEYYRRTIFKNSPVTITSGWRSLNYNLSIGGAKKSYHIDGLAVDFVVKGFTKQQLYDLLNKVHFGGLELHKTLDYIHIDLRGSIARFDNFNTPLKSTYSEAEHNAIFHPTKKG